MTNNNITNLIYENILQVDKTCNYNVYIFDAYGVFYSGADFYPEAIENMKTLMDNGKHVYILSNTTETSEEAEANYNEKGFKKGIYYKSIMTSGETLKLMLSKDIRFTNKNKPAKIYMWGAKRSAAVFDIPDINTIFVEKPEDSDFIYFSAPLLTRKDIERLGLKEGKDVFANKKKSLSGEISYNCVNEKAFETDINSLLNYNKPFIFSNLDEFAPGKDMDGNTRYFIRQGTILKLLKAKAKEMNITREFILSGKPSKEMYDWIFNIIENDGISIDKKKILIVGDTLKADIQGGLNAGIDTCLCLFTGNTKKEFHDILERQFGNQEFYNDQQLSVAVQNLSPQPTIAIKAVGKFNY